MKTIKQVSEELDITLPAVHYWINRLRINPVAIRKTLAGGIDKRDDHTGARYFLTDAQIDRIRQARS